MMILQNLKFANPVPPGALVDDATVTCAAIDCKGADELAVLISLGATDQTATVCKLQECETSGGSYTDITGAALTPLPGAGDDNGQFGFFLSLQGRMRYIKLVLTIGGTTGGYVQVTAIFAKLENGPLNATDRGLVAQCVLS